MKKLLYWCKGSAGLKLAAIALIFAFLLAPHLAWALPQWLTFLLLFFGIIIGSIYVKPRIIKTEPFTFKSAIYQYSAVTLALLIAVSIMVCLVVTDFKPVLVKNFASTM